MHGHTDPKCRLSHPQWWPQSGRHCSQTPQFWSWCHPARWDDGAPTGWAPLLAWLHNTQRQGRYLSAQHTEARQTPFSTTHTGNWQGTHLSALPVNVRFLFPFVILHLQSNATNSWHCDSITWHMSSFQMPFLGQCPLSTAQKISLTDHHVKVCDFCFSLLQQPVTGFKIVTCNILPRSLRAQCLFYLLLPPGRVGVGEGEEGLTVWKFQQLCCTGSIFVMM